MKRVTLRFESALLNKVSLESDYKIVSLEFEYEGKTDTILIDRRRNLGKWVESKLKSFKQNLKRVKELEGIWVRLAIDDDGDIIAIGTKMDTRFIPIVDCCKELTMGEYSRDELLYEWSHK